jgi:hypothetical protein
MKLSKLRDKIGSGFLRHILEDSGQFTEEEINWIMDAIFYRLR